MVLFFSKIGLLPSYIKRENKKNDFFLEFIMKAMVLEKPKDQLKLSEVPIPKPSRTEVAIKVHACGVCRTDLHIIDGELDAPKLPLIPGHQIVGTIEQVGDSVVGFRIGDRVGVPWLGWTCGSCECCVAGEENLCENALFTGYTRDGGFAEYAVADERYCFPLPSNYTAEHAAPLLCAGLIGYRALRFTNNGHRLGFYGFGAAAHILTQITGFQKKEVYAFTRPGDNEGMEFARKSGAVWVGGSDEKPPVQLDAAIVFAPVGALVPAALAAIKPSGIVVCAGIYMSDIPSFPYSLLWMERSIRSVANLTRDDGREFFDVAAQMSIETRITTYPLECANKAIDDIRNGKLTGAAVITIEHYR
jgi:alcohol dehydrogenase, propanol-preferring